MVAKAESELTARFLDYSRRVFVWNIVGKPERIGNYTAQTKCLDKGITRRVALLILQIAENGDKLACDQAIASFLQVIGCHLYAGKPASVEVSIIIGENKLNDQVPVPDNKA
ncbi:hypothetical protein J2Z19_004537 [Ensifer adhaerens]|uniref:Uncharacterized protein n=1 Tax=Ensifer adhaerens TaxID=106592 RepID=A0ACC5T1L5_ENSAD|nr:hypothetical protein [Ensifer adhaerens]MBP1874804.1 hypothetical protein [Ensifer adhaerens]